MLSVSRLNTLARSRFTLSANGHNITDTCLVFLAGFILLDRPRHALLFVLCVGLGSERCFDRALLPVVLEQRNGRKAC